MRAELTDAEADLLATARQDIGRATLARYGRQISGSLSDLELLQQLVDDRVFGVADEQSLLSIGVVLGDVIAAETAFRWAAYSLEGRTPALILPGSDVVIFAVQMVLKRVENGEDVNLSAIVEWSKQLEREKK